MKINFSVHHEKGNVIVKEKDWEMVLAVLSQAGYEIKQTFTPAQQSVHWIIYVVLVAAILMLGVLLGRFVFGG